ncbi:ACT domain-containing protein ACR6-like [Bidens hawaiensis]|uniref:ACT domain-containing protein ACR6-like n=1 Tax=Bidens hawaiensis TaxID=980011 RepID=UPI004049F2D4
MEEDEYAKLIRRMNPPRVTIDNNSSPDATIIQVESVKKHGILLEVVQLLSDLGLLIKKAYISSDASWFMDVFNVIYHDRSKIRDERVVNYIKKVLETSDAVYPSLNGSVGLKPSEDYTSIELVGTDRPGLLSEVSAVLTSLGCNVANAEIWTHNARAAAVVHVTDEKTNFAVEDPKRLSTIKKLLCNVLKGNNDLKTAKMTLSTPGYMHRQRRLHQIMFAERDYEKVDKTEQEEKESGLKTQVTVFDCAEKDYTVIRLALELELCTEDRVGLLSDITRIFRENSLCIKRAEISTEGGTAKDKFYVTDMTGNNPVDPKTIDSIQSQIGEQAALHARWNSSRSPPEETTMSFLFGSLFKCRSFQTLKLVGSYSRYI